MNKFFLAILVLVLVTTSRIIAQQSHINIEDEIEKILSQLTLEEKVAMCHAQSKFSTPGVPRLGIPEIWMSDGPHGVRAEISWDDWSYAGWTNDSITAFPALTCLAATFNPELAYQYGISIGEEARYRKKDVLLGPGVNIYRTPLNGRNFEYMGEDPFLASIMVVPYIKGVQENGVAACVKHYALNNQELWRNHINVEISDRALHEIYLPAFKVAVEEAKVWSIMGAYNQFRGQHCCHNKELNDILKKDWAFDGVVISDWSGTHSTLEAAFFGLDMEMGTGTDGLSVNTANAYDHYYLAKPFLETIISEEVNEVILDDKVRRILRLMYRTNMNPHRSYGRMNNVEHQKLAREVAKEGIVLLKNDNSFFPIDAQKNMTIAVIGENAVRPMTIGGGSSELKAKYEISPLEGLKNRFQNATITHSLGYASGESVYGTETFSNLSSDSLFAAAMELASTSDIVIFVGGLNKNYMQDCEGGDRTDFSLPYNQNTLIEELKKANTKVGVVLVSGNAVSMPWIDNIDGILQVWYLGSEGGNAIADIISGDANPSAKLPFSFPVNLTDNAAHHFGELSYPGDSINQYYKEDILVGYRWHDTKQIKPLFAFGHGLSYTKFDLTEVSLSSKDYIGGETIMLSCTLNNTGDLAGAEVIQVYIGKADSKVARATKELKGFSKVYLEKNESATFEIEVKVDDLAFYDESISDWNLEKGKYIIYVGNASDNISEELKINLK